MYTLLLPEGQKNLAWEASRKERHFVNREALDRKAPLLRFKNRNKAFRSFFHERFLAAE